MNLSEVIEKLNSTREEINTLQTQLNKLHNESNKLNALKNQIEVSKLIDYIQIGDEYEFTKYMSLKGVQTGKDTGVSPSFRDGDKIQFVKKNTKSIVVKCLKKIVTKNVNGTIVKTETNPDTLFRIDIDSLYYNIMHDTNFKTSFHSYIKRKESLEQLGI
jgi:hypothetical protein